ncbi:MAG: NAD-dependent epimerase/dehydratase family protein [Lachnospiraceae bacterium]|nr:NAD-dependent epimerase/dehydratase family protein [Lachnospiraceae bacterium]
MKQKMYIITGANGHLASTIIRYLVKQDCLIRGLILPSEENRDRKNITYYKGDITKPETMDEIFSGTEDYDVYVIHTAGIISVENEVTPLMYNVNVNGTKNIIEVCKKYAVKRLLYVSSVHAIQEGEYMSTITELYEFPKDKVQGGYASTKAEATQAVMDSVADGLDVVVVHPSGILGPFDKGNNHITQLIQMYLSGKLPAGVTGGYDFVDVRDVAQGCISAVNNGRKGECYILSNRYYSVKDLLEYMRIAVHGKHKKVCVPLGLAKMAAPIFEKVAEITKTRPLFTKYSLYIMDSNGRFCHDKATKELGYMPRDMKDTIRDTIVYLKSGKAKL